jgi:hypothetical protein
MKRGVRFVWGAHACGVLVAAFCRNELLTRAVLIWRIHFRSAFQGEFAMAECHRQHAASVRSPEDGRSPLLAISDRRLV